MAESSVIYATAGDVFGTCSQISPCKLDTAVTTALSSPANPIIRMLPGTYTQPLAVQSAFPKPLAIVGTGATIVAAGDTAAVTIDDGANVSIRGLSSTSSRHIHCGKAGAALSNLSMRDIVLVSIGNVPRAEITRCTVKMSDATMSLGEGSPPFGLFDDATLDLDRVHLYGNAAHNITLVNAARVNLRVTNSLFENVGLVHFGSTDAGPPGTRLLFAYDTFIFTNAGSMDVCGGSTVFYRSVTFENSIIAPLSGVDAIPDFNPANCTFVNTILSRQATPPPGTVVANPLFVDVTARNFRVMPISQASTQRSRPRSIRHGTSIGSFGQWAWARTSGRTNGPKVP